MVAGMEIAEQQLERQKLAAEQEEQHREACWAELLMDNVDLFMGHKGSFTDLRSLAEQGLQDVISVASTEDNQDLAQRLDALVDAGVPKVLRPIAWKAFLDTKVRRQPGYYSMLVHRALGQLANCEQLSQDQIRDHAAGHLQLEEDAPADTGVCEDVRSDGTSTAQPIGATPLHAPLEVPHDWDEGDARAGAGSAGVGAVSNEHPPHPTWFPPSQQGKSCAASQAGSTHRPASAPAAGAASPPPSLISSGQLLTFSSGQLHTGPPTIPTHGSAPSPAPPVQPPPAQTPAQPGTGRPSSSPQSLQACSVLRKTLLQIEKDLPRTLASQPCMQQGGEGRAALRRILAAFALHNPGVGYTQGMNFVAAVLLMHVPNEEEAFYCVVSLVEDVLPAYYAQDMRATQVDQLMFGSLLRRELPALGRHLQALGADVACCVFVQWFLCLFVNCLPMDGCLRVWDIAFRHRSVAPFFQVALALFATYGPALLVAKDMLDAFQVVQAMAPLTQDVGHVVHVARTQFAHVDDDLLDELREEVWPEVARNMAERAQLVEGVKQQPQHGGSLWQSLKSSSSSGGGPAADGGKVSVVKKLLARLDKVRNSASGSEPAPIPPPASAPSDPVANARFGSAHQPPLAHHHSSAGAQQVGHAPMQQHDNAGQAQQRHRPCTPAIEQQVRKSAEDGCTVTIPASPPLWASWPAAGVPSRGVQSCGVSSGDVPSGGASSASSTGMAPPPSGVPSAPPSGVLSGGALSASSTGTAPTPSSAVPPAFSAAQVAGVVPSGGGPSASSTGTAPLGLPSALPPSGVPSALLPSGVPSGGALSVHPAAAGVASNMCFRSSPVPCAPLSVADLAEQEAEGIDHAEHAEHMHMPSRSAGNPQTVAAPGTAGGGATDGDAGAAAAIATNAAPSSAPPSTTTISPPSCLSTSTTHTDAQAPAMHGTANTPANAPPAAAAASHTTTLDPPISSASPATGTGALSVSAVAESPVASTNAAAATAAPGALSAAASSSAAAAAEAAANEPKKDLPGPASGLSDEQSWAFLTSTHEPRIDQPVRVSGPGEGLSDEQSWASLTSTHEPTQKPSRQAPYQRSSSEQNTVTPHQQSFSQLHTEAPHQHSPSQLHTEAPHQRSPSQLQTEAPHQRSPYQLHTEAPHQHSPSQLHTEAGARQEEEGPSALEGSFSEWGVCAAGAAGVSLSDLATGRPMTATANEPGDLKFEEAGEASATAVEAKSIANTAATMAPTCQNDAQTTKADAAAGTGVSLAAAALAGPHSHGLDSTPSLLLMSPSASDALPPLSSIALPLQNNACSRSTEESMRGATPAGVEAAQEEEGSRPHAAAQDDERPHAPAAAEAAAAAAQQKGGSCSHAAAAAAAAAQQKGGPRSHGLCDLSPLQPSTAEASRCSSLADLLDHQQQQQLQQQHLQEQLQQAQQRQQQQQQHAQQEQQHPQKHQQETQQQQQQQRARMEADQEQHEPLPLEQQTQPALPGMPITQMGQGPCHEPQPELRLLSQQEHVLEQRDHGTQQQQQSGAEPLQAMVAEKRKGGQQQQQRQQDGADAPQAKMLENEEGGQHQQQQQPEHPKQAQQQQQQEDKVHQAQRAASQSPQGPLHWEVQRPQEKEEGEHWHHHHQQQQKARVFQAQSATSPTSQDPPHWEVHRPQENQEGEQQQQQQQEAKVCQAQSTTSSSPQDPPQRLKMHRPQEPEPLHSGAQEQRHNNAQEQQHCGTQKQQHIRAREQQLSRAQEQQHCGAQEQQHTPPRPLQPRQRMSPISPAMQLMYALAASPRTPPTRHTSSSSSSSSSSNDRSSCKGTHSSTSAGSMNGTPARAHKAHTGSYQTDASSSGLPPPSNGKPVQASTSHASKAALLSLPNTSQPQHSHLLPHSTQPHLSHLQSQCMQPQTNYLMPQGVQSQPGHFPLQSPQPQQIDLTSQSSQSHPNHLQPQSVQPQPIQLPPQSPQPQLQQPQHFQQSQQHQHLHQRQHHHHHRQQYHQHQQQQHHHHHHHHHQQQQQRRHSVGQSAVGSPQTGLLGGTPPMPIPGPATAADPSPSAAATPGLSSSQDSFSYVYSFKSPGAIRRSQDAERPGREAKRESAMQDLSACSPWTRVAPAGQRFAGEVRTRCSDMPGVGSPGVLTAGSPSVLVDAMPSGALSSDAMEEAPSPTEGGGVPCLRHQSSRWQDVEGLLPASSGGHGVLDRRQSSRSRWEDADLFEGLTPLPRSMSGRRLSDSSRMNDPEEEWVAVDVPWGLTPGCAPAQQQPRQSFPALCPLPLPLHLHHQHQHQQQQQQEQQACSAQHSHPMPQSHQPHTMQQQPSQPYQHRPSHHPGPSASSSWRGGGVHGVSSCRNSGVEFADPASQSRTSSCSGAGAANGISFDAGAVGLGVNGSFTDSSSTTQPGSGEASIPCSWSTSGAQMERAWSMHGAHKAQNVENAGSTSAQGSHGLPSHRSPSLPSSDGRSPSGSSPSVPSTSADASLPPYYVQTRQDRLPHSSPSDATGQSLRGVPVSLPFANPTPHVECSQSPSSPLTASSAQPTSGPLAPFPPAPATAAAAAPNSLLQPQATRSASPPSTSMQIQQGSNTSATPQACVEQQLQQGIQPRGADDFSVQQAVQLQHHHHLRLQQGENSHVRGTRSFGFGHCSREAAHPDGGQNHPQAAAACSTPGSQGSTGRRTGAGGGLPKVPSQLSLQLASSGGLAQRSPLP